MQKKLVIDKIKKRFWKLARITKTESIVDFWYHIVDALIHQKEIIWLKFKSVKQYCEEHDDCTLREIETEKERPVYVPPFFEQSEGKKYLFNSPSIYVAVMRNMTVLSATGVILTDKYIVSDMMQRDQKRRIKWPWGAVRRVSKNRALLVVERREMEIEKAVNLCGFASNNYYHFTMEILSRLEYVNQLPETENIPILIDEGIKVYPQLEELLNVVNPKREVIYIPHETQVKIHLLIQPSMNTWGPLNIASWDMFRISDNLMAQSGIWNIRSCVDQYMVEQSQRKIFISRRNYGTSRLKNEAEIIPLFELEGFEIVYPEALSYVDQIQLFSSAKCVVGVTGAAMTNILYCHPGTVVGCVIPREYDFCVYSTIAELIGVHTLFLSPDIVSKSECIVAESYYVEEGQCKRYIKKILEMCV